MLLMLSVIAALVVGWQVAAFAAAGISGNFESSDGNKPKQTHDDWDTITPIVNRNDTTPKDIDESFNDKEDTPQPKVVTGSIPGNKSDLTNFRIYQNKGTDGHDYLYMYWQRANILGTANMDFEFNQRQCTANFQTPGTAFTDADCANNGVAPQDSPNAGKVQFITPLRSEGDFLFTFDFALGGNQANLNLLRWLTSAGPDNTNADCEANGATLPCWGNKVALNGSGNADGAVNTAGNADTNPLFQKEGEAALDLTDTVFADK
jgi:hypothetical protein